MSTRTPPLSRAIRGQPSDLSNLRHVGNLISEPSSQTTRLLEAMAVICLHGPTHLLNQFLTAICGGIRSRSTDRGGDVARDLRSGATGLCSLDRGVGHLVFDANPLVLRRRRT